ncbi:DUF1287 domain-containing protein [Psychrobacter arenosus]|uniref:DUF1287 domain-containing protein n=1 Tax=Psychrobacter arenosus TaxID=256326 RepID=UPI0022349602|nr:DUF1287 domain-containing protein [Psychrobacter arenosus]
MNHQHNDRLIKSQLLGVQSTRAEGQAMRIVKSIMAKVSLLLLSLVVTSGMALANHSDLVSNGVKLARDAKKQIGVTTSYDPTYRKIDFPRGDVPIESGVCTDVVIRAYRLQNIDLQQLVNHDMQKNWDKYPKIWGLTKPDKNIDHRRVPNLEVFFAEHGESLSRTDIESFKAGDIVTWRLPKSNLPHMGIVSNKRTAEGTPLIVHNIGRGTQQEDILFKFPIKGHYRY